MKFLRMPATERRRTAVLVLLIAAVVAASVLCAVQLSRLDGQSERRAQRADVLAAARTSVLALTSIDATTTDGQMKSFLGGMSKRLKEEFEQQADSFRRAMTENKVQATGRIAAIAVKSLEVRRATVVVAAAARVANSRTTDTQDRNYRLSLSLEKVGERWLVDSMEFVS